MLSKVLTSNFRLDSAWDTGRKLWQKLQLSRSNYDFLSSMMQWSKLVADRTEPSDCLNGCDGPNSPAEIFINELLQNDSMYKHYLSMIQTPSDVQNNAWLLGQLNFNYWKQPVLFYPQIQLYIQHSLVGKYFSFYAGNLCTKDYYECNNIVITDLDVILSNLLQLYKRTHYEQKSSEDVCINIQIPQFLFVVPDGWKQYLQVAQKELTCRQIWSELPFTQAYIKDEMQAH